jgi:hypothetical protein
LLKQYLGCRSRKPLPRTGSNVHGVLRDLTDKASFLGPLLLRVFITGATDYIGGAVAVRLIDAGHKVCGLARSPARGRRDQRR